MSALPKPPSCGQNWLAMSPTVHGRHCGQCDKEIYDFSAKSWAEIEQTQAAHGNALCGMYSPAQLRHWGQQPPAICAPLAAATALALSLSTLPTWGQAPLVTSDSIRIRGIISLSFDGGQPQPAPGTGVVLMGTSLGTTADTLGHYELVIPTSVITASGRNIQFFSVGFKSSLLTVPAESRGTVQHDVLLKSTPAIVYAVKRPSLLSRSIWRLRYLFSFQK